MCSTRGKDVVVLVQGYRNSLCWSRSRTFTLPFSMNRRMFMGISQQKSFYITLQSLYDGQWHRNVLNVCANLFLILGLAPVTSGPAGVEDFTGGGAGAFFFLRPEIYKLYFFLSKVSSQVLWETGILLGFRLDDRFHIELWMTGIRMGWPVPHWTLDDRN